MQTTEKMGKVALGNIAQRLCDRCVREDTKQALKGNLQADGVQSRQTLFVRYCLYICAMLPDYFISSRYFAGTASVSQTPFTER